MDKHAPLNDLRPIIDAATAKIRAYGANDIMLPSSFKKEVTKIYKYNITYNNYSTIASMPINGGKEELRIYFPNQWFIIASYLPDFYNQLIQYRDYACQAIHQKKQIDKIKGRELSIDEKHSIESLGLDETSQHHLITFLTDYSYWRGGKSIERNDFYISALLSVAGVTNNSSTFIATICTYFAKQRDIASKLINEIESIPVQSMSPTNTPSLNILQQITYGAPGTGKSHQIKQETSGREVVRTTFHPETDYASFVGCYKPVAEGGNITYGFVPQAFARAYVKAWQLYGNGQRRSDEAIAAENAGIEPVYLVIEEINRGNCAQIFGDLFQLLDRSEAGFSKYPVYADADLAKYLAQEFAELELPNATEIDTLLDEEGAAEKIKQGTLLALPPNLYLRATMNTSDQSLFPIDSAFKRRWDWRRVGICDKGLHWQICVDENRYDWWDFLKAINAKIATITASEDKQLGYFFCTLPDGEREISAEILVSKVFFYLWTDVFKDYELDDPIFRYTDAEGEEQTLTFDKFFDDAAEGELIESRVTDFLERLGLMPEAEDETEDETRPSEDEDDSAPVTTSANGETTGGYTVDEADNAYAIAAESDPEDHPFAETSATQA